MIAGIVIWYKPEYQLADPIATFGFSILVLWTTKDILSDSLKVLMESTPEHVDAHAIRHGLAEIPSVSEVHDLHIWSLTMGHAACSVHLTSTEDNCTTTLIAAQKFLKLHGINHSTIQVITLITLINPNNP